MLLKIQWNGHPHGRVVAIREIQPEGFIFFTQKGTRKVEEMTACPNVSLTFWQERLAREVIIEGTAEFLSQSENERYWNTYPKWAQIRFHSYAATSGQPIVDKQVLEDKKKQIEACYNEQTLPMNEHYCGVYVRPKRLVFYAYRLDELSDVCEYVYKAGSWVKSLLSP